MVMAANHSSYAFVELARANPTKLGQLWGPIGFKKPKKGISFALDNDAYTCWTKGLSFDYPAWVNMLNKMRALNETPLWVAVPDVVADRQATLAAWKRFAPVARCYGWPLAFVLQDGMTHRDVPKEASVVFVGGTTSWKWRTIPMWVEYFPRVHVGRCGTSKWKLDRLEEMGVESCDGSGFFRATWEGREARQLRAWLSPTEFQTQLL